jgi:Bacterial capsule synthesis protein PGA_cap
LIVSHDTAAGLTPLLGAPAATVKRVQAGELVDTVWKTPHSLAILPFDQLTPRLIALALDGQSVLDRQLDLKNYPLVVRVYVQGNDERVAEFYNALREQVAPTNRDPKRMTSLVMTGVTAMGRFTADTIDKRGDPAFPARVVAPVLSQADITHVSNEIPFVENCPPNLTHDSIVLCSKPSYMETFKLLGVDIVGLTGNHAGDFGYDNYVKTLELYEKNGIKHYAGGRNLDEARKPLIVEHNGNRIAFLGANSYGPQGYWATPDKPGTNGYDPERMKQDIAIARRQANLVFVEYQADEVYDYKPDATNIKIFRRTLDDGADVVTGVQNHHPAAVEFAADGTREILYGLGNFSFDQMYDDDVRGGLIPRHLIYDGKLLQTELLTTMLDYYAQPRWATASERQHILDGVFGASGFNLE